MKAKSWLLLGITMGTMLTAVPVYAFFGGGGGGSAFAKCEKAVEGAAPLNGQSVLSVPSCVPVDDDNCGNQDEAL